MRMARWGALLGWLTGFAACNARGAEMAPSRTDAASDAAESPEILRALDVLFVIDNSGSMLQEQQALPGAFVGFFDELRRARGGMPDLHLAIVSTDMGAYARPTGSVPCARPGGDRGRFDPLVRAGDCGALGAGPDAGASRTTYLAVLSDGTMTNFVGDPADVLGCMAELGTSGCGYEHPLQSMRIALDPVASPHQSDFLRDGAQLLVVFVGDEDDCSGVEGTEFFDSRDAFPNQTSSLRCAIDGHLCNGRSPPNGEPFEAPMESCTANPAPSHLVPVATFVDALLARKQRIEQVHVAVVAGQVTTGRYIMHTVTLPESQQPSIDLAPSCTSAEYGAAAPALRLRAFADAFGARGHFFPLCDGIHVAMSAIARDVAGVFR